MTLPDERTRAVLGTRDFLFRLLNPEASPRVPRWVRLEALRLLRHFPHAVDMAKPATAFSPLKKETK